MQLLWILLIDGFKNFLKSPLLIYKCSNSIGSRAASCSKAKYDGNDLIEILRSARFRIIAYLKSFILRLLRLKIHLRAATGQLLNLSFIVPPDKIQVTTKDNRQNKRDLPSRSLFKIIRVVILDRSQGFIPTRIMCPTLLLLPEIFQDQQRSTNTLKTDLCRLVATYLNTTLSLVHSPPWQDPSDNEG